MEETMTRKTIEQVLAEADSLVNEIDAALEKDAMEKNLVDIEKRVQHLKAASARMKEKMEAESEKAEMSSYAEGYHEAFEDISRALRDLKEVLT